MKERKINDNQGSSYVKIDKLVDLFELTSITIENDDRAKSYLFNNVSICLMKSLLSLI